MGHIVNPIALRLSYFTFWNSSWVSNLNYSYFLIDDLICNQYLLDSLVVNNNRFQRFFFMFSHFSFYRCKNKSYILCHFLNWTPVKEVFFWIFFEKSLSFMFLRDKNSVYQNFENNKSIKFLYILLKIFCLIYSEKRKLILFNSFSYSIKKRISYFCKLNKDDFQVIFVPLKEITASILASYIAKCLERGYSFSRIFYPILKYLKHQQNKRVSFRGYKGYYNIGGIRVCYSGRFKKKRRVFLNRFEIGSVSLNSVSAKVSYGHSLAYTRFGVGGVKVWLCR